MSSAKGSFSRRDMLKAGTLVAAAAAAFRLPARAGSLTPEEESEVSPAEDLMREHGILNRILLIYDEAGRRLARGEAFPMDVLSGSARVIRSFIEDYHEKLEENYLFPRFEKARKHVELVNVLKTQHARGRTLTGRIEAASQRNIGSDATARQQLILSLEQFVRMYRPHEAREDTVLFPALHTIVTRNEYDALGEEFEKKEHQLFGREGFEGVVEKVAAFEKSIGIYNLEKFTPLQ